MRRDANPDPNRYTFRYTFRDSNGNGNGNGHRDRNGYGNPDCYTMLEHWSVCVLQDG